MKPVHAVLWGALISIVLVGALGFWQSYELREARTEIAEALQALRTVDAELSAGLKEVSEAFRTSEQQTADAFGKINASLSKLGQNINLVYEESQRKTQELAGRLQLVQQESAEKISELESRLKLNLKSGDFSGIVDDVINGVVSIRTNKGIGSGAIVTSDGYIVTNYHVIDGASSGAVRTYDGKVHDVSVIGYDVKKDIAVLKIEGSFNRLRFSNSDGVTAGERVIALGSPAGLEFSVNEGIVSARRILDNVEYLQIDVALNPGNSGGPVVDASGKIVGISNWKLKEYEGLSFAIAGNEAKAVVAKFVEQI
ncbi:MAG: trypsin-like peptidase domain-containing protein [Candidatus Woesearchaeota archaeon]